VTELEPKPGRPWKKFVADLALWSVAAWLAFPLRQPQNWSEAGWSIPLYLALTLPIRGLLIAAFGLHRQSWRQVTVHDLEALLRAIAVATVAFFTLGVVWHEVAGFPRTVPLIAGVLAIVFMGGARLAVRLSHERDSRRVAIGQGVGRRVLLVGAGDAGARMVRDMRRHAEALMTPIGYLDDDVVNRRLTVAGLPVLGTIDDLWTVCRAHQIDEVLITMPSASGKVTRRVVESALRAGVPCRILPGVTEILAGHVDLHLVRDVQVEDLLRRAPAELDLVGSGDYLAGQVVLVTGAGGSIGSEVVRQVARLTPAHVILYGQGENSLHAVEQELARDLPGLKRSVIVGTIRDRVKIERVMTTFSPSVVFHAAAHKHVPMMERHPDEAILNNVGGTRNVAEAALAAGVHRFVNVSTDKAVNPSSMVGATKSVAERVVRAIAEPTSADVAYVSVRFGNVLGSRGSVVPIFQEQIRRGGPITLTHPDMTRYFMTIPEASRLVIQAGALAQNGCVYVLDMGTPVKIIELARDMIRLSGLDPDEVEIIYSGLRPGEKLNEELFADGESVATTPHSQILMAEAASAPDATFLADVGELLEAAAARDWRGMGKRLEDLVPGFLFGERGDLRADSPPVRLD